MAHCKSYRSVASEERYKIWQKKKRTIYVSFYFDRQGSSMICALGLPLIQAKITLACLEVRKMSSLPMLNFPSTHPYQALERSIYSEPIFSLFISVFICPMPYFRILYGSMLACKSNVSEDIRKQNNF